MLSKFLSKAFRGQDSEEDLELYINYLNSVQEKEQDWHLSVKKTMAAILSSAKFLYLIENEGELNPLPLASRLSYLIWSTTPDKKLLDLAKNDQLKESEVYEQQIDRLVNDSRSDHFLNSFASQWLQLDVLGTMRPDTKDKRFKAYNPKIENDLRQETKLFFQHVFKK